MLAEVVIEPNKTLSDFKFFLSDAYDFEAHRKRSDILR